MQSNLSPSVAARRVHPTGKSGNYDYFPTPPWGVRALCEHIISLSGQAVWEPAGGAGHMARGLDDYASKVIVSDICPRHERVRVFDFLSLGRNGTHDKGEQIPCSSGEVDWIITNPPFSHIGEFIEIGLDVAVRGVAVLGRIQLLEGIGRFHTIYRPWDGHFTVAPFVERLPIEEGVVASDTSTASSYAWLVIDKLYPRPSPLQHIPPCRADLERSEDYDPPELVALVREEKKRKREGKLLEIAA